MRIRSILLLLALFAASPAAAQEGASVMSMRPLPAVLTPASAAPTSEVERRAGGDEIVRGGLTGALVGAATGAVYGAFFARECGVESDCDLSREYKAVVFTVIGASLGALMGAGIGAVRSL